MTLCVSQLRRRADERDPHLLHALCDRRRVRRQSGRVLKVRRAMRPWRMAAAWRAFAVVEMAAGALDRAEDQAGAVVRVDAI